jgi:glycosyltransferase involved in cell wall biosynthesis
MQSTQREGYARLFSHPVQLNDLGRDILDSFHLLHSEAATGWGGQEIRIFQESQALIEKGYQISVITQPGSPLAKKCREFQHSKFAVYSIPMSASWNLFDFWSIYRIVKRIQPDIIHTHSSIDSWLFSMCGKALKIPIVRSRHVSIPIKNYFPKNAVYSYFPNKIIASGETIRLMMAEVSGVKNADTHSIPAGVDMKRFDFNISPKKFREEIQIDLDQPLIGKIGVIRGWKGHDYFLEAATIILKKVPNAKFVIAGSGPGFDEISRKVITKGLEKAVFMLGHREDIPEIIAALNILVLASTGGEATSQVIPQAFAMKTPVVGTRAGGIPEILGDEERGLIAEPKNGSDLADKILSLLENPIKGKSLSDKAYKYCLQKLTFETHMDKTISVYRDTLKEQVSS